MFVSSERSKQMTKTLATAKNRNGFTVRLQQRGKKFDVIYCTGFCWKYIAKAVTEQSARFTFDLEVM
jgi:hypothetical protein